MKLAIQNIMLLPALIVLGACTTAGSGMTQTPTCGGSTMVETQLFFGMNRPDGGSVSEEEWNAFMHREIVPRFEEGFAVMETNGFWQDGRTRETFTEPGRMISRLLRPGDAEAVPLIIEAYKQAFKQESVLRIDTTVCVRF